MSESLPFLLIPGLACSARLYHHQIPSLWRLGPVMVADHTRADTMDGIAAAILRDAPPRFHVIGLSMIAWIALELWRQASDRIGSFVFLHPSARADRPEQAQIRQEHIKLAETGKLMEVNDLLWPWLVHESRRGERDLRAVVDIMAEENGAEAFIRQQHALIGRVDVRSHLSEISCPALVVAGDGDIMTPPKVAREVADAISGSQMEIIDGCGHLSTLEQPQAVTKLLIDWYSRNFPAQ